MARTLTTRMSGSVSRSFTYQARTLAPIVDDSNSITMNGSLENGNEDGEADLVYHMTEELPVGANNLLDVYGTLVDAFGNTIRMTAIKCLAVKHKSSQGTLTVGGGANAVTSFWETNGDSIKLQADGAVVFWADEDTGYPVTSGTAENINIAHNSDTALPITYEILIVGVST